ncbi:MAG: hypothetical protein HPY53_01260 [Brevinematales bacterium]|nr:hypothetical protein [Brevinematales bacterium]
MKKLMIVSLLISVFNNVHYAFFMNEFQVGAGLSTFTDVIAPEGKIGYLFRLTEEQNSFWHYTPIGLRGEFSYIDLSKSMIATYKGNMLLVSVCTTIGISSMFIYPYLSYELGEGEFITQFFGTVDLQIYGIFGGALLQRDTTEFSYTEVGYQYGGGVSFGVFVIPELKIGLELEYTASRFDIVKNIDKISYFLNFNYAF